MQSLKVTTPGPDGHYHIVYINSDTGAAAMSPARDGHTHEIMYDPPREPAAAVPGSITDPSTGQSMPIPTDENGQPNEQSMQEAQAMGLQVDPGQPEDPGKEEGTWVIAPMGAMPQDPMSLAPAVPTEPAPGGDYHEHELIDYVATSTQKKQTEKETLDECMSLWREALELSRESRKRGKESEDFYAGKQWDEETERYLRSLDRASLTINEIASNIDTLVGYQMEQRTDWRCLPREGGDQRVSDMLTEILKSISDACYFPREETKVFRDQCVPGMGVYNTYMDFAENIQGNIKIERFPWSDIHYGPHEKEDLADCEYEVRSRMQSIAKLKQMFGKKADDIESSYKSYAGQYPDVSSGENGRSGTNQDYQGAKKIDDAPYTVDGTFPLIDVQKKQFRLVQVTRKTYKEVTVIFNQEENFFFTAYDWKDKDIAAASEIPGFQVISQLKTRMRITKFCGNVILSDEDPADLPLHDFYTVPAYGYRQNGEFWGKVEAAKDPQRELNKRRSQIMDTMNRLGASVYYTTPDTFIDKHEEERFKKNRSKPGAIFKLNEANNKPQLEEGADLPAGLVQIMQLDQENLQRLMNVVVQQAGANESGAMFLEKKKSRLTGNQFIFDNLSFAKQKLGRIIIGLIKRYYPAERIERLLNTRYMREKFKIGGEDFGNFSRQEIVEMLEGADLLENDVIVAESSFSETTRMGIAKVLFDLIEKGAPIPPELALEFVPMPSDTRARIKDTMAQQAETQAMSEQTSGNTEITKTLVAAGQYTYPPEKAAELGLVPVQSSGLAPSSDSANNTEGNTQATEYADNLASSLAG